MQGLFYRACVPRLWFDEINIIRPNRGIRLDYTGLRYMAEFRFVTIPIMPGFCADISVKGLFKCLKYSIPEY